MTVTFVPCGAKLPVIAMIAGALFHNNGLIALFVYVVGIVSVLVSGIILKKFKGLSGRPAPFVMELPHTTYLVGSTSSRERWTGD